MASNADIKQHISTRERAKWNKMGTDLDAHVGAGGIVNHPLADGTTPGFSTNDFTSAEKKKLSEIQEGALNNPHPASHPYTMIEGLAAIAHTGSWTDLINVPQRIRDVENGVADAATVSGGIRITIGSSAPSSPRNNKEIWVDTANLVIKTYTSGNWEIVGAAFR